LDPIGDNPDDFHDGDMAEEASARKPPVPLPKAEDIPEDEEIPEVDETFVTELNERNLNFVIVDPRQPGSPIIFSSPGFCELTGYSSEEVRGRNCRFLQGKDTNRNAIGQIARAIQEVQPIGIILLNYKKDGSPFWNLLSLTPTKDQDGNLLSFIGVQMDVSNSLTDKKQQAKLREAKAEHAREKAARGVVSGATAVNNDKTGEGFKVEPVPVAAK
jgi:PAS domain S-box-containing protein